MKTYSEKLKDPRWQKTRLLILNRDGFSCRDCGSSEEELHVHHCFYTKGNPWDADPKFLLSLCRSCHERRGREEAQIRELIGVVFSRCGIEAVENIHSDLTEAVSKKSFCVNPELSIRDSTEMEYQTITSWFYDLAEVTGSNDIFYAVLDKRRKEGGRA